MLLTIRLSLLIVSFCRPTLIIIIIIIIITVAAAATTTTTTIIIIIIILIVGLIVIIVVIIIVIIVIIVIVVIIIIIIIRWYLYGAYCTLPPGTLHQIRKTNEYKRGAKKQKGTLLLNTEVCMCSFLLFM